MSSSVVGVLLLALAGFGVGGVISAWRTSRPLAALLAVLSALALAGAVAWLAG